MSTLRQRLEGVDPRAEFQQYLQAVRESQGRSHDEVLFFTSCDSHRFWAKRYRFGFSLSSGHLPHCAA